jgi:dolichol kinase
MTRCSSCNGIMRPGENQCFTCGDRASKSQRKVAGKSFAGLITLAFFASLALTCASWFFSDRTPPFTACLACSVILLFVKRSADVTSEKKT